jgi:hypothetical protein
MNEQTDKLINQIKISNVFIQDAKLVSKITIYLKIRPESKMPWEILRNISGTRKGDFV